MHRPTPEQTEFDEMQEANQGALDEGSQIVNHLPTCFVGNAKPCPSDKSLHDEPVGEHWWSGWPGAWCMKCGASDPVEECVVDCKCPCHANDFAGLSDYSVHEDEPEV